MAELRSLEARLLDLRGELVYPPTPDFRRAVRARIQPLPRFTLRLTLAAAAAVLLAIGLAVAAAPQARETVAGWLGIRGVSIQRQPSPPAPSVGGEIGLSNPVTLSRAESGTDFKVVVPAALGTPDEVYLDEATGAVTLLYRPRPGLPAARGTGTGALVVEFKGSFQAPLFQKVLGPDTTLEQVSVNGAAAYWLAGSPHDLFSSDSHGGFRQDRLRLATNTLIWQKGSVTYRLEADVTLEEALRIARSMAT